MKKVSLIILVLLGFLIPGCQKLNLAPDLLLPDLGKTSYSMKFLQPSYQSDDKVVVSVAVTPGAKYSFQLTDIKGDVIVSRGLLADEVTESVIIDISKVNPGMYNIEVVDISGLEIKQPISIK